MKFPKDKKHNPTGYRPMTWEEPQMNKHELFRAVASLQNAMCELEQLKNSNKEILKQLAHLKEKVVTLQKPIAVVTQEVIAPPSDQVTKLETKGRKPKKVFNESMPVRPPVIEIPEELSVAEKLALIQEKYQEPLVEKCRVIRERKKYK